VVVECKSPKAKEPIPEPIDQLLRYSEQRDAKGEGSPPLFYFNQFVITTCRQEAKFGTITTHSEKYFYRWADPYPRSLNDLEHGNSSPNDQQRLVAGMLDRDNLLDINLDKAIPPKLRNIADAFLESRGITVKVEPISILDENFQKEVKTRSRTKTKTAEIEHAIRHHLDVDLDDDPDLQASFAEALRILRSSGITGTRFTRSWRSFASALQTPRKNQPSGFTGRSKCPSSVP
jgi:hypothetical protein